MHSGKTFFIADTHFGDPEVIHNNMRPFASIEDMDDYLGMQWNRKVKENDTVYILGDFMTLAFSPRSILRHLNGKKHLIVGNHDASWMSDIDTRYYFESVANYREVTVDGRDLVLSHYPMLMWPHMHRSYMIHGHIHDDTSFDFWPMIVRRGERLLNAGVDVNGYEPVTFDELTANNRLFKADHPFGQPHRHPCTDRAFVVAT